MKRILYCILPLCLSAPLFAQAAEGYVVSDISLQAGPDTEYPSIVELPAGAQVEVEGCIDGFTWCDVIAGDNRGWVAGSFIQEDYDNQRVVIEDYGPRIGIPIVAFSLGVYWDLHYHNRPFYAQRTEWEGRHIQPRQPPRPSATALRNAAQPGGRAGEHQAPPPKPVAQQATRPATTEHQQPKAAPEVARERARPAPVAQQAAPHPVSAPKQEAPRTAPEVRSAPPKAAPPKVQPKAPPKEEPKKDEEGGHKDDSKEH
ncbi:MAG: hypothetical protein P4L92_16770 [Rudaea sp.]|nr:hypothetical protein [Rudaea sp.]